MGGQQRPARRAPSARRRRATAHRERGRAAARRRPRRPRGRRDRPCRRGTDTAPSSSRRPARRRAACSSPRCRRHRRGRPPRRRSPPASAMARPGTRPLAPAPGQVERRSPMLIRSTCQPLTLCISYTYNCVKRTQKGGAVMASRGGISVIDLGKHYGDDRRARRREPRRPAGRRPRPARAERRGQDHHGPHPLDARRARPGRAIVSGYDVVTDAAAVRREIGLTGQFTAVDELLTGREMLEMLGRLLGLGGARHVRVPTSCSSASTWPTLATGASRPTPAACAASSTWPPASSSRHRCCSSTSRRRASILAAASACGLRSASSRPMRARPCCSRPSISRRPTGSPIGSR